MRRINEIQSYYIDNHLSLSDQELAKTTGLTVGQIKARRRKVQGLNREGKLKGTPENVNAPTPGSPEVINELTNQAQKQAATQEAAKKNPPLPEPARPVPGMRIDQLISRGKGTTSLTPQAAQLGDAIVGATPKEFLPKDMQDQVSSVETYNPFNDESRVHRIKK